VSRFARKRNAVLALMTGAAVVMIGWSQIWVTLEISAPELSAQSLSMTGQASTVLPVGLALITLATSLVLLTARRLLSYVIAAINICVSASLIAVVFMFLADPVSFELKQLSAMTGIADSQALHKLVSSTTVGFGLWLSFVGALVIVLGGIFVAVGAGSWKLQRSRYDTTRVSLVIPDSETSLSTLDAWDEMTKGADPTS
jgi:uncharacterized membrane protein (TIGR02234 family)